MKDLIAFCGLDCEKCEARIATLKKDDALKEKVAKEWSEMNHVTITPEMIPCEGCRVDGAKSAYCDALCPIRQCGIKKGIETCGDCSELSTCEKVAPVIGYSAEALANLTEKGE